MKHNFSTLYINILDMLYRFGSKSIVSPVYGSECTGTSFKRIDSGKTKAHMKQEIVISDNNLWKASTPAEWYLIGRITDELKMYNALWYCDPQLKKTNSNVRVALKGLISRNILIKTETTNIYFVNPVHIRRGDTLTVLATMASMLKDVPKVNFEHIVDKKPVKELDTAFDHILLGNGN